MTTSRVRGGQGGGLQALPTPLARAAAFLGRKISTEKVVPQLTEKLCLDTYRYMQTEK